MQPRGRCQYGRIATAPSARSRSGHWTKSREMPPSSMRYFPLFADLAGARVLVVGGGEQAAQKVRLLCKTEAHITVVAATATDEITGLSRQGAISHFPRAF